MTIKTPKNIATTIGTVPPLALVVLPASWPVSELYRSTIGWTYHDSRLTEGLQHSTEIREAQHCSCGQAG